MSVGVKDYLDAIQIVERHGGAVQQRVIESPVWRVSRPDHPGDLAPVRLKTGSATLGQQVVEVPEAGFEVGGRIGVIALLTSWIK